MFKDVYIGLLNRIQDKEIGIKHIDWFNHQYEETQDELKTAWSRPAVFIEFRPVTNASLTNKRSRVQTAQLEIRLHLVTDNVSDPRAKSSSQGKALLHYDFMDSLYNIMEGYAYRIEEPAGSGEYRQVFNSLTRSGIEPDHNQTNIIVTIQTFTCFACDYAAARDSVKPGSTPNLVIE